ncbi:MAG: Helix-turn-helix protein, partial [Acidobacteriota bacterium]|nr:Helix-turn-helix protein [Acidobacteriota bacterium]
LSQRDFAAQLDIAGSYLSEIEAGKTRPGFEFFYKTSKIFKINPIYLLHGKGTIFLETEKSWYHDIDFGTMNREVQNLIWHMAKAPTLSHAMLEFFARYLYANQELIAAEMQRISDEKEKE